jgi:hypothetical protein
MPETKPYAKMFPYHRVTAKFSCSGTDNRGCVCSSVCNLWPNKSSELLLLIMSRGSVVIIMNGLNVSSQF